jgi:predicted nucleic acid-binding protein
MSVIYLDSSALVKLVVAEPESAALRRYLRRRRPLVSSALARTEVLRSVLLEGASGLARVRDVLSSVDLIKINERILDAAGVLQPVDVRSLDAIHLATAQQLGSELSGLVAYDERLLDAAATLGFKTLTPR